MLSALSPLDGRYVTGTTPLKDFFSEYALIRYRVFVEIEYLKALISLPLSGLESLNTKDIFTALDNIVSNFDEMEAMKIKETENKTNHDVKAVEYYIKDEMTRLNLGKYLEFVHLGLTSQDINNTAFPLMLRDALEKVMIPKLKQVLSDIEAKSIEYKGIPMLAHTHGQPASPTTLGKEFQVFLERLQDESEVLKAQRIKCKFGGATGNFNAHKVTYPNINWQVFADQLTAKMGLYRSKHTTQIAHYDDIAAICHNFIRINTILIDFCRDMWSYISMDYFKQKVKEGEVGSSAMPHKVNPIDFENAEGNLGMSIAVFEFMAAKLPVSRLQRDLTDSTVLRNLGVPFGHTLIALNSIIKGIGKLQLNHPALDRDLEQNWAVVAEAIQNILRRELYPEPYETLKTLTRGKVSITQKDIQQFILNLNIDESIKNEMLLITPQNYIGYY